MGKAEHSWTSVDRAHERQGEADEDFDKKLAKLAARHAAAMRTNATAGHEQTLSDLAESLAHRMGERGNLETLIRAAISCGPHTAGNQLLDMIDNCIQEGAETAAFVEMDREERASGLDFAAIRAAASQEVQVPS